MNWEIKKRSAAFASTWRNTDRKRSTEMKGVHWIKSIPTKAIQWSFGITSNLVDSPRSQPLSSSRKLEPLYSGALVVQGGARAGDWGSRINYDWCRSVDRSCCGCGFFVPGDYPPGVNNTGEPSEDSQADVDPKVGMKSSLQEDSDRRKKDCEEVKEDIRVRWSGLSHYEDEKNFCVFGGLCRVLGCAGVLEEW